MLPHKDTSSDGNLLSRGQEITVEVDEADAVDIVLQPGQMSLHHGLMFHASGPNVSDDRRIGLAIRHITPDVEQHVSKWDYGVLVRGCNHSSNFLNVARPSADFATAATKLYEQIVADLAVALTEGAAEDAALYAGYVNPEANATIAPTAS